MAEIIKLDDIASIEPPARSSGIKIPQFAPGQKAGPQRAYRNNNPFNLMFAGQKGATPGEEEIGPDGKPMRFAVFGDPESGYQAGLDQISLDSSRGMSLRDYISKFAPASHGNDTAGYIKNVSTKLGLPDTTPLSKIDRRRLAEAQLSQESGSTLPYQPRLRESFNRKTKASSIPANAAPEGNVVNLSDIAFVQPPGMRGRMGKGDLPKELPGQAVDTALSAAPYVAGGLAGMATGGLPWWLAATSAGLAQMGARAGEQEIRSRMGEEVTPEVGKDLAYSFGEGAGGETGGRILMGALGKVFSMANRAKNLYQSSLKPAGSAEEKALKAVEGGLTHAIPLDDAAANEARKKINLLNDSIERAIVNTPNDIPAAGYVRSVQMNLDQLRSAWKMDATRGKEFVKMIDEYERNFLINHGNVQPIQKLVAIPNPSPGFTPGTQQPHFKTVTIEPEDMSLIELRRGAQPLPTQNAQQIKKQTYETIRTQRMNAYDPDVHTGVNIQANQEIARALKDELAAAVKAQTGVDISKLNLEEGSLIEFEHAAQRFLKRESNKNTLPYLPFVMGGGVVGGLSQGGDNLGYATGALAGDLFRRFLSDPAVQSRVAIMMYKLSQLPGAGVVGKAAPYAGPFTVKLGQYGAHEVGLEPKYRQKPKQPRPSSQ